MHGPMNIKFIGVYFRHFPCQSEKYILSPFNLGFIYIYHLPEPSISPHFALKV